MPYFYFYVFYKLTSHQIFFICLNTRCVFHFFLSKNSSVFTFRCVQNRFSRLLALVIYFIFFFFHFLPPSLASFPFKFVRSPHICESTQLWNKQNTIVVALFHSKLCSANSSRKKTGQINNPNDLEHAICHSSSFFFFLEPFENLVPNNKNISFFLRINPPLIQFIIFFCSEIRKKMEKKCPIWLQIKI